MRARTTLSLIFALSCGSLATTSLSHAQEDDSAEAKKQFGIGTKAFSSGNFAQAAQAFEAAAALKPNAVALYTAALAWEQATQSERAADDYGRALEMTGGGLNAQQTNTARDRITALEKTLGTLAITGPDGTKVQLDQFTEAPIPIRIHGTAGTHSLSVRAPGKQPEKREVLLEGGATQKLDVSPVAVVVKKEEPKEPPPKEVVVEKQPSHMSVMKGLGFTAIGLGAASVLGAILLGLSAEDAGDAYRAAPSHAGYVHANALATWTTVSWITAGVFVAAGVTLVLIPEKSNDAPAAPPKQPETKTDKSDSARLTLTPSIGGFMFQGSF